MTLIRPAETGLRATVERLATIQRPPASGGEREAADWIAERLRDLQGGGLDARIEEEPAFPSYARPIAMLTGAAAAAGLVAGRGGRTARLAGTLAAALATAGIVDDVSYGRQAARRVLARRQTACNVVAEAGDPHAERTLVVMAHHDAAPAGVVFDHRLEYWFARRYPHLMEQITANPPMWWAVVAGPALVALGSALDGRRTRRAGIGLSLAVTALLADIACRRAVPGANDNLSGVAVLIALAEALRERPLDGLRVILLSAGAEEALQEGVRGFMRRHRFDPDATWFLNLDTVGSGNLVLLESEGPLRMEGYDERFKDLIADAAAEEGVVVKRGLRSRNSTDGVAPIRHGYRAATLVSVDDHKLLPHYHNHTDLPEHVHYRCVADAAVLAEAVARRLSGE